MNLENPKKQKVKEPSQKNQGRCGKDQVWIFHLLLNVLFLNLQSSVSYILLLLLFLTHKPFFIFHVILIVFQICTLCSREVPWFLIPEGVLLTALCLVLGVGPGGGLSVTPPENPLAWLPPAYWVLRKLLARGVSVAWIWLAHFLRIMFGLSRGHL